MKQIFLPQPQLSLPPSNLNLPQNDSQEILKIESEEEVNRTMKEQKRFLLELPSNIIEAIKTCNMDYLNQISGYQLKQEDLAKLSEFILNFYNLDSAITREVITKLSRNPKYKFALEFLLTNKIKFDEVSNSYSDMALNALNQGLISYAKAFNNICNSISLNNLSGINVEDAQQRMTGLSSERQKIGNTLDKNVLQYFINIAETKLK
ncbi:MAG: hypothetical protein OHK0017_12090 [Patescibacteria group bacterium]